MVELGLCGDRGDCVTRPGLCVWCGTYRVTRVSLCGNRGGSVTRPGLWGGGFDIQGDQAESVWGQRRLCDQASSMWGVRDTE